MAELMDHVEALADGIGPRPVSTEEERQAALYIAQELTDLGLEVDVDEFTTPTGTRWVFVVAFAAIILGTVLSGLGMFVEGVSTPMFILGLLFAAAGFAVYHLERANRPVLSQHRAGGISQNVVAKYVPSSLERERRRRKVIIAAHVDTVRAEPQAAPALVNRLPLIKKVLYYLALGLVAVLFIRLLPLPWPDAVDFVLWIISLIGCIGVAAAAIALVANRFMPYVSGGNDNASAAAVMLDVARCVLDPAERERYAHRSFEEAFEDDFYDEYDDEGVEGEASAEPVEGAEGEEALVEDGEYAEYDEDGEPVVHSAEEAQAAGVVPEGAVLEYGADASLADSDITAFIPAVGTDDDEEPAWVAAAEAELDEDEDADGQAPSWVSAAVAGVEDAAEAAGESQGFEDAEYAEYEEYEEVNSVEYEEAGREGFAEADPDELEFFDDPVEEAHSQEHADAPEVSEEPADADAMQETWAEPADEELHDNAAPAQQSLLADEDTATDPAHATHDTEAGEDAAIDSAQATQDTPAGGRTVAGSTRATQAIRGAALDSARATRDISSDDMSRTATAMPEPAAPAPVSETARRAASRTATAANVPSWYTAARRKAAQDRATAESGEKEEAPAQTYRSRFADMPTRPRGGMEPTQQEELQPPAADDAPVAEEGHAHRTVDLHTDLPVEEATPQAAEQTREQPDIAVPFTLDISDEDIDDISPESTGTFAAVSSAPAKPARSLDVRIPSIGASGRMPAVAADDDEPAEKPQAEHRRPRSRHVTQDFQPTKVADEREELVSGATGQMAPVQSSYEQTPQASASRRRSEARSRRSSSTGGSSASGTQRTSADASKRPGSTSSFPALTGTFPALTGSIPKVSADAFDVPASSDYEPGPDEDFSAFSPAVTSTIEIPESRFHNAVDNVGGFFSKLGRKSKNTKADEFGSGDAQDWNDDEDDFGWKGGGYFTGDDDLGGAARRRAAEIRDSVITMTENDLLDKEVWFVALGASDANGQGMKNFLDLHSSELRGSLIINLEAVGAGDICYVENEGTGKPHRADRRLTKLVKQASRDIGGREIRPKQLDWRNTDATPAMLSGLRAISIMGFDDAAPVNWHWSADTSDAVNPDKMEYVSALLLSIIENS